VGVITWIRGYCQIIDTTIKNYLTFFTFKHSLHVCYACESMTNLFVLFFETLTRVIEDGRFLLDDGGCFGGERSVGGALIL
jgi:hypothetical protein